MRKIRFATAIRDFSRRKGGAERYLVDLCARMASEDFEVHVYAEHWEEEVEGIHFHRVKTISFPKSAPTSFFCDPGDQRNREGTLRCHPWSWKYPKSRCPSAPWRSPLGLVLEEPESL